jgi:hypothetical protein
MGNAKVNVYCGLMWDKVTEPTDLFKTDCDLGLVPDMLKLYVPPQWLLRLVFQQDTSCLVPDMLKLYVPPQWLLRPVFQQDTSCLVPDMLKLYVLPQWLFRPVFQQDT